MYSSVDTVRLEAGGPDPVDVTDQDIIEEINAADSLIRNSTQWDWQPTDASYPLVTKISKMLAASFVMDKYDDPKGEAENEFNKGMMLLQQLVTEDESSGDVVVASPDYKTWPLNPNAKTGRGRLFTSKLSNHVNPEDIYDDLYDQE